MPNSVCLGIAISRNARVAQVVAKLGFEGRVSSPKHKAVTWHGGDGNKEDSGLEKKPDYRILLHLG